MGGGIEDAVVDHPLIAVVHIALEVAVVHGQVVAGDDDGGVVPEGLRLQPVDKFQHLTAGAGDGLLVGLFKFAPAVGALVAADVVGVHGEHGEGEGLGLLRNLRQLLLCVFKEVLILHAPPYEIIIVDNTFPTPVLCRPFEFGCDIVTHATTKYMDGHSTQVGGCIVDSGNFEWAKHPDKFPGLVEPDESYHGLSYVKSFGKNAYIVKCTAHLMRDFGSIPSPFNAFLVNVGLESLHLRIRRHAESALKIAKWLKTQKKVAWVNFAGLSDSPYRKLLKKQFSFCAPCGVLTFGIKGGRSASIKFMDSLKIIGIVTHVADAWSCVLHPASHTHRQLTDRQLEEAGIPPDLIRLSVGLEDCDDLIADLKQALAKVK